MSFDRSFSLLRALKLFNFAVKIVQQALEHDQAGALDLAGLAEADRLDRRLEAIVLVGRNQLIELGAAKPCVRTRPNRWDSNELGNWPWIIPRILGLDIGSC